MKLLHRFALGIAAWGLFTAHTISAQVQQIDPNTAIDSDLALRQSPPATPQPRHTPPAAQSPAPAVDATFVSPAASANYRSTDMLNVRTANTTTAARPVGPDGGTYHEDDLIGAAEGVFGKGAKGLALMIQDILKKQGQPNAYVTGREAGGAVVVGLRYGSGTLHHKVEGERAVYWTGPSLGFDFGANAANTFVLVYNLHDSQDLFRRYGAGEGQAYFVGGFNVSYLRRGDVVLIPVRLGAGLRLGVNAGYMKFSQTQKWMPL